MFIIYARRYHYTFGECNSSNYRNWHPPPSFPPPRTFYGVRIITAGRILNGPDARHGNGRFRWKPGESMSAFPSYVLPINRPRKTQLVHRAARGKIFTITPFYIRNTILMEKKTFRKATDSLLNPSTDQTRALYYVLKLILYVFSICTHVCHSAWKLPP